MGRSVQVRVVLVPIVRGSLLYSTSISILLLSLINSYYTNEIRVLPLPNNYSGPIPEWWGTGIATWGETVLFSGLAVTCFPCFYVTKLHMFVHNMQCCYVRSYVWAQYVLWTFGFHTSNYLMCYMIYKWYHMSCARGYGGRAYWRGLGALYGTGCYTIVIVYCMYHIGGRTLRIVSIRWLHCLCLVRHPVKF